MQHLQASQHFVSALQQHTLQEHLSQQLQAAQELQLLQAGQKKCIATHITTTPTTLPKNDPKKQFIIISYRAKVYTWLGGNSEMKKQVRKKIDGCCHFCGESDYSLLDVHRIIEGQHGGKYTDFNCVTCCSLCHRKVHSGRIKILGKHYSTAGRYVLHYLEDEQEIWK